jgi:hypothetical protein
LQGLLLFVLPAGRSAEVKTPIARLICDRLWGQGIEPGAATAATRITEALQSNPLFGNDLHFDQRELTPLLDAAEIHPQTWADLLDASDLAAMTPSQRKRLLTTCEALVANLAAHSEHGKVSALSRDLEHLRHRFHSIP